jgi:hypothetical protein
MKSLVGDETEQFYMKTDEYKIEMLVAFRTGSNTELEYSHFSKREAIISHKTLFYFNVL